MTAEYFPVVIERESNGTFSAWVAGLPGVYAAADTAAVAKRAIRRALAAHLDGLRKLGREPQSKADIFVLRLEPARTRIVCGSPVSVRSWGARRAQRRPTRPGGMAARAVARGRLAPWR